MALTATEQKQIRDALCAIVVRGLRYPDELKVTREALTQSFDALKVVAVQPAAVAK
jgi:tRNA G26 N,N-dimethylase Trm1